MENKSWKEEVKGVLFEIWRQGNTHVEPNIDQALLSLTKIFEEVVGSDKPLYGGYIERALKLPPDIECSNTGYNQAKNEIRQRLEEK
jgi:hypothetical protein